MIINKNENTVFFDIDLTLLLDPNGKGDDFIYNYYGEQKAGRPHRKHVELLKAYNKRGFNIICWSNNGFAHCEEIIDKLNIKEYVYMCMSKPQKVVDDESIEKWCKTIFIPEE